MSRRASPPAPSGHRTPRQRCACGYEFDAASAARGGDVLPRAGDVTLCIRCGALYEFGSDLTVRPAPPGLLASLPARDRATIAEVRDAIAALRRERGRS